MTRTCFSPPGTEFPGLSQLVRQGPWIMLSGQIAFANGKLVGKGDPEAQAKQCFANIAACLAGVGADLSHVVKINAYFTDIAAYPAYSKIKSEVFRVNPPTGTGVIVSGLLVPDALMEIEVVAYRED